MTDKEKLIKLYQKTIDIENKMLVAREKLDKQASKMLGYEVVADYVVEEKLSFVLLMN